MPNTLEIIDNKVWVNGNVVIPELFFLNLLE